MGTPLWLKKTTQPVETFEEVERYTDHSFTAADYHALAERLWPDAKGSIASGLIYVDDVPIEISASDHGLSLEMKGGDGDRLGFIEELTENASIEGVAIMDEQGELLLPEMDSDD